MVMMMVLEWDKNDITYYPSHYTHINVCCRVFMAVITTSSCERIVWSTEEKKMICVFVLYGSVKLFLSLTHTHCLSEQSSLYPKSSLVLLWLTHSHTIKRKTTTTTLFSALRLACLLSWAGWWCYNIMYTMYTLLYCVCVTFSEFCSCFFNVKLHMYK